MTEQEQTPLRLCRCWFADGVLICDTPEVCYAEDEGE